MGLGVLPSDFPVDSVSAAWIFGLKGEEEEEEEEKRDSRYEQNEDIHNVIP